MNIIHAHAITIMICLATILVYSFPISRAKNKTAYPLVIAARLFLPSLLLPPFVVPIALIFANWETGRLPKWASWLETPDQPLPGDRTIPEVDAIYKSRGRFMCSWYWLGFRNTAQGWANEYGVPATAPWSPLPGYYEGVDKNGAPIWWNRQTFFLFGWFTKRWPVEKKTGWRTYPDGKGGWTAVPCLTATRP